MAHEHNCNSSPAYNSPRSFSPKLPTRTQSALSQSSRMPSTAIDAYARACNPSRRAKRLRPSSPSPSLTDSPSHQPQMPSPPSSPHLSPPAKRSENSTAGEGADDSPVSQRIPAKRGRKPGPLSRAAREAQRKLNHSIIEKARRTKINDALATLRKLVPVDYGTSRDQEDVRESEGEEDGDADYAGKGGKAKPKAGKREEKEKEFKLEILVRTVSFLQDLVDRVAVLEGGCSNCQSVSKKRKRFIEDEGEEREVTQHRQPPEHFQSPPISLSGPASSPHSRESTRLPSIASWLNTPLEHPNDTHSSTQATPSQLPSPPSSLRFDPVRTTQQPPALSLGPVATSISTTPSRTPDEESAATLLLQISTSPPLRFSNSSMPNGCPPLIELPKQGTLATSSASRTVPRAQTLLPQTPGSLLGLTRKNPVP